MLPVEAEALIEEGYGRLARSTWDTNGIQRGGSSVLKESES